MLPKNSYHSAAATFRAIVLPTVLRWLSGYLPFGCADDPGSNPDAAQINLLLFTGKEFIRRRLGLRKLSQSDCGKICWS